MSQMELAARGLQTGIVFLLALFGNGQTNTACVDADCITCKDGFSGVNCTKATGTTRSPSISTTLSTPTFDRLDAQQSQNLSMEAMSFSGTSSNTSVSNSVKQYSILIPKPRTSCPTNFTEITATFGFAMIGLNMTHLDGNATHLVLCGRPSTHLKPAEYCVLSSTGGCPVGFKSGLLPPFFLKGNDVHFNMCCSDHSKGEDIIPLEFPLSIPFYLIPNMNGRCQGVDGFKETMESVAANTSSLNVWGPAHNETSTLPPYFSTNEKWTNLTFCYYTKKDPAIGIILDPAIGIILGCSVTGTLMFMTVFCACCRRKRKAYRERIQRKLMTSTPSVSKLVESSLTEDVAVGGETSKSKGPVDLGAILKLILDQESQLKIHGLLIRADKLEVMNKVGKGAFGTVYKGRYKPDDNPLHAAEVAIKTLKDTCVYPEINAFMEEAMVMADFNHKNILRIVGVCVKPETEIPMIVLPYMCHGDLQRYCRQFRYDDTLKDQAPDLCQLLSFALHIARGMEYLASLKFIHRDLAARNCMLDNTLVVKLADFGLTRDVYSNSYYRQDKNKLLPIKWMSLESLQDRVFTSYTDVWSYGVTLWEIFTLGKVPYPDLENAQVLTELENGGRLKKPTACPESVYDLMQSCWLVNPKDRPNFTDIGKTVEEILSGYTEYLDLEGKPEKKDCFDVPVEIVCSPIELVEQKKSAPNSYPDYRDPTLVSPSIIHITDH